jgi:RND family efflux transporter MFP subunit
MSDLLLDDLGSLKIDRAPPPASGRPARVVKALVALALLAALGVAIHGVGLPYLRARAFKTEVTTSEILIASPAQAQVELSATGYVVAETTSKVGAKIAGRVGKVHVKEGDVVAAGDLLVELEDAGQRSALAAARSRAAAAWARARTSRVNLDATQVKADREARLVAQGVTPRAGVYEDLVAGVASQRQEVQAADAEAHAADAEVQRLAVDLAALQVVAPIAGTVMARPLAIGELVGPTSPPLLELADFSSLVVETDVAEGHLAQVEVGSPCEIVLDAYPQQRLRGATLEISRRVNRAKGSVPVKVRFVDVPANALPEMAARVSFLTAALDPAALKQAPRKMVPTSAVTERQGVKVVFVVDQDAVRMVPVTVGTGAGPSLELVDGPPEGTRVVVDPPAALENGTHIKEKSE